MSAATAAWIAARQEIEAVCNILIDPSPPNLDRSAGLLGSAAARLQHAALPAPAEVRLLRHSLHRARALLEFAGNYHRQWHKILESMTAGYTAAGESAPLSTQGRVSMQG